MRLKQVFEIDDVETLKLITHPLRFEILEYLAARLSVTELAELMKVPRTRLYHHVKALQAKGVIRVVSTRRAGAIDESIYQASARSYRPSRRLIRNSDFLEQADVLLATIFDTTKADLLHSVRTGVTQLPTTNAPPSVKISRQLSLLTRERLSEFIEEFEALLARYDDIDAGDPNALQVAVVSAIYPTTRQPI